MKKKGMKLVAVTMALGLIGTSVLWPNLTVFANEKTSSAMLEKAFEESKQSAELDTNSLFASESLLPEGIGNQLDDGAVTFSLPILSETQTLSIVLDSSPSQQNDPISSESISEILSDSSNSTDSSSAVSSSTDSSSAVSSSTVSSSAVSSSTDSSSTVSSSTDSSSTDSSSTDSSSTVSNVQSDDLIREDITNRATYPIQNVWGDVTWELDAEGTLTFTSGGTFADTIFDINFMPTNWAQYKSQIKKVVFTEPVKTSTNAAGLFVFCNNLESIEGLEKLDTSQAEHIDAMFLGCSKLKTLDLSNFDTSNAVSISVIFGLCTALETVDVSSFDTSKMIYMNGIFQECNSLTTVDVSNFDTSSATDISKMFDSCGKLTSVNVSNFDTSNVTNMESMFRYCSNLTSLDLSNFNTSNVTNMATMLQGCDRLYSLTLGENFESLSNSNLDDSLYFSSNAWTGLNTHTSFTNSSDFVANYNSSIADTYIRGVVHNINYELDGGTNSPSNLSLYPEVAGVGSFADPTKVGYQFKGWFADSAFTTPITSIAAGTTTDITLYAQWEESNYTISFNSNGGTGTMAAQKFGHDEEKSLSANNFTKEGHTFISWNTQENATGTTYTDQEIVKNISNTNGDLIVLYAQWNKEKYIVNFDTQGGGTNPESQSLYYDDFVVQPSDMPTKVGATFTGWYTEPTGGEYWDFSINKMPAKNITLYAQYEPIQYVITFDPQNGSALFYQNVEYGNLIAQPTDPQLSGYTFLGWFDSDGNIWDFNTKVISNISLTAKWEPTKYYVTYLTYDEKEIVQQMRYAGQTIEAIAPPSVAGHTFAAWVEKGTENKWNLPTVMPSRNVVLVATYDKVSAPPSSSTASESAPSNSSAGGGSQSNATSGSGPISQSGATSNSNSTANNSTTNSINSSNSSTSSISSSSAAVISSSDTIISDNSTPQTSVSSEKSWSLLGLFAAIVSIILSVVLLAVSFKKDRKILGIVGAIIGIVSVVLFFIFNSLTASMQFFNLSSLAIIAAVIIQAILLFLASKEPNNE